MASRIGHFIGCLFLMFPYVSKSNVPLYLDDPFISKNEHPCNTYILSNKWRLYGVIGDGENNVAWVRPPETSGYQLQAGDVLFETAWRAKAIEYDRIELLYNSEHRDFYCGETDTRFLTFAVADNALSDN